jgi:hypothetical protein
LRQAKQSSAAEKNWIASSAAPPRNDATKTPASLPGFRVLPRAIPGLRSSTCVLLRAWNDGVEPKEKGAAFAAPFVFRNR